MHTKLLNVTFNLLKNSSVPLDAIDTHLILLEFCNDKIMFVRIILISALNRLVSPQLEEK